MLDGLLGSRERPNLPLIIEAAPDLIFFKGNCHDYAQHHLTLSNLCTGHPACSR